MKLYVIKEIQVRKSGKVFRVSPGGIVEIKDPLKAQGLITSGHVRPLLPADSTGDILAIRIWSKILDDEIWVLTSAEASVFVPDGEIYYLPEEIRNLKGASPDEIRAVHMVKKSIGGRLIATKEREG